MLAAGLPLDVADTLRRGVRFLNDDVWQALLATMDLFAWLEQETAVALHYQYPTEGEAHTAKLVQKLFTARETNPHR